MLFVKEEQICKQTLACVVFVRRVDASSNIDVLDALHDRIVAFRRALYLSLLIDEIKT